MNSRRASFAVALLVLAPSCADARQGEIACQQRLLDPSSDPAVSGPQKASPGENAITSGFAALGRDYEQMSFDGCSDNQRQLAPAMARAARNVAAAAQPIDDALLAERQPGLRDSQPFRELQSRIELFDHRRRVLRQELERMTSQDRRR